MKIYAYFAVLYTALVACGTQETKEVRVPYESNAPATNVQTSPQPDYLPAPQAPQTTTPQIPVTIPVNQTPTVNEQPTTNTGDSKVDPFGTPYNPTAEIPYADEYTYQAPSQYNPTVPAYYNELETYIGAVAQPIVYMPGYQLPYLYNRYCQYRALMNYYPSFRRVVVGQGPWTRPRYDRMRDEFDRSQRWVNYDLYEQINQNLSALERRQYRSPRGLENQIRDSIRRRDHRSAAKLHDELLDEASRGQRDGRREDRENRDERPNRREERR